MYNYQPQYLRTPYGYQHHDNDERFVPGLGLGLGFLGGLATGALITPGPGFGYRPYYRPYPYYYRPYPYYQPYPYYGPYPYYR